MLIEFSVANFRSYQERQTISLVKAKGDELQVTHTFNTATANSLKLLRSAAIYGPNASGKSNILRALRTMQEIVRRSATRQRGDRLPIISFRLSASTLEAPSEFEAIFIAGDQSKARYQYGFAATAERIHEEWLLAYPKGRPQRWFERKWDASLQQYHWTIGNHLQGEKHLWQKATRDNALFLSTAVQLNSQQLQPIYDWFDKTLHFAGPKGWSPEFSARLCERDEGNAKQDVLAFLKAADLPINDIIIEQESFDPNSLPGILSESAKDKIISRMKDTPPLEIKTVRKSHEGQLVHFAFEDESDGTQKLFNFAGPWIDSLNKGHVLLIDELHDNLHPVLAQFLVQRFHSNETNCNNAQLVFTTHETTLLNQSTFRRDQIWFCEKDKNQASCLYPLTDFSPRKGRENLEQGYLSGRYGALPFIRQSLTQ